MLANPQYRDPFHVMHEALNYGGIAAITSGEVDYIALPFAQLRKTGEWRPAFHQPTPSGYVTLRDIGAKTKVQPSTRYPQIHKDYRVIIESASKCISPRTILVPNAILFNNMNPNRCAIISDE